MNTNNRATEADSIAKANSNRYEKTRSRNLMKLLIELVKLREICDECLEDVKISILNPAIYDHSHLEEFPGEISYAGCTLHEVHENIVEMSKQLERNPALAA